MSEGSEAQEVRKLPFYHTYWFRGSLLAAFGIGGAYILYLVTSGGDAPTQVPSVETPTPAPSPEPAPKAPPQPATTPEPVPEPPELGEPDPITEKPRFEPRVVESDPTTRELNLEQLKKTAPIVGTVMKDGVLHDVYESTVRLDESGQPFKYYFPHRG